MKTWLNSFLSSFFASMNYLSSSLDSQFSLILFSWKSHNSHKGTVHWWRSWIVPQTVFYLEKLYDRRFLWQNLLVLIHTIFTQLEASPKHQLLQTLNTFSTDAWDTSYKSIYIISIKDFFRFTMSLSFSHFVILNTERNLCFEANTLCSFSTEVESRTWINHRLTETYHGRENKPRVILKFQGT